MRTICLYFEIHQIIHLKRFVSLISVQIIITMMIMLMRQV